MRARALSVFALISTLASSAGAFQLSASNGEASFGFLKFSLSPRSTALGGAGVALVSGIADADLNPAAALRDSGGVAAGQSYLQSVSATGSYAAWNIPLDGARITAQARYLGFDNLSGYGSTDQPTAAYGAHLIKLQAGYAGSIAGFDYGASASFAQNNVADATYAAGMVNVGVWRELGGGFAAAASLLNADFWISKAQDGSAIIAPTVAQAGVAWTRKLPRDLEVSVAADARKRNDEDVAFPVGAEVCWQKLVSARVGYPIGETNAALSAGLGLRWSRYGFEYAYQGNAVIPGSHFWVLEIRY